MCETRLKVKHDAVHASSAQPVLSRIQVTYTLPPLNVFVHGPLRRWLRPGLPRELQQSRSTPSLPFHGVSRPSTLFSPLPHVSRATTTAPAISTATTIRRRRRSVFRRTRVRTSPLATTATTTPIVPIQFSRQHWSPRQSCGFSAVGKGTAPRRVLRERFWGRSPVCRNRFLRRNRSLRRKRSIRHNGLL